VSLLGWLAHLFTRKRRRDISRLEADGDEISETVDLSGGPLKEHHRRLAIRDRRLLPKPKKILPKIGRGKRPKYMSFDEATRLFAGTLRTRNRELRDLATDEEQLARYNLPLWRTEEDVAAALGITVKKLRFFSTHREKELTPHYVTFAVRKRSGGERLIMAPKRRLKALQRQMLALLVERLPVSEHAHGFRRAHSVRSNAEPHVGKAVVVHLDIKDFFPSVTFARVRGMLIALGYSYPVAATLAAFMTESARQPVDVDGQLYHVPVSERHCVQGAPTSPALCNSILLRLDRRLSGLARKFGFTYTRYADDLSFSGDADHRTAHGLCVRAARIVEAEGFTVNATKTRIMGQGRRQTVTGVVVNQQLGLSRQERRRLRAMAHQLARQGPSADPAQVAYLRGKLAYLSMLNPVESEALRKPPMQ